jgi:tRNA-dihydrouridine synthase 2
MERDVPSDAATADWCYRNKLILAPMVRVNSLAFRTVCAEYGCDMLYSEEIVAKSLIESKRSINAALGTVDFTTTAERGGGRVILRVRPKERIVLQLGTACAAEALQAAQMAAADVRAVDLVRALRSSKHAAARADGGGIGSRAA